jgi:hypothetical protein
VVYYGVKEHEARFRNLKENGAKEVIAKTIVDFLLGNQIMVSYEKNQGIETFMRSIFFADESFDVIVSQEEQAEVKMNHFEIRITENSSFAHQADMNVS